MDLNFFTIMILIFLVVWIVQPTRIILSQRPLSSWKPWANIFGATCLMVGGVSFLLTAFVGTGGLNWLPNDVEWPVGMAKNVLITTDGTHIVPHEPTGRIQIYDKSLKFQRGWLIDVAGGMFKLVLVSDQDFLVFTAREDWKYRYDLSGRLMSSEKYDGNLNRVTGNTGQTVEIPTPFYLTILTHPFHAWTLGALGMLLLFLTGEFRNWQSKGFKGVFSRHREKGK